MVLLSRLDVSFDVPARQSWCSLTFLNVLGLMEQYDGMANLDQLILHTRFVKEILDMYASISASKRFAGGCHHLK